MHESDRELADLQRLLDASYATAGAHLRSIHAPHRRLPAGEVAARLTGMRLLVLATVTAAGVPITGPVDAVFFRGAFCFGTDPGSLRWRHLLARPAVSATHLPSEDWAVTVHGDAVGVDVSRRDPTGLRAVLLETYRPRYGDGWEGFLDGGPVYARIEARRMFAVDVSAAGAPAPDPPPRGPAGP